MNHSKKITKHRNIKSTEGLSRVTDVENNRQFFSSIKGKTPVKAKTNGKKVR
jgi:hypothetical protein